MSFIIFPNQLFEDISVLKNKENIYLVEHHIFFKLFPYHKLKLILMRSSMKKYVDYLKTKTDINIKYYNFYDQYENIFKSNKNKSITIFDPIDHDIMKEINMLCVKYKIKLIILDSPNFMCNRQILEEYDNNNSLKHSIFYKWCRKKFRILVDENDNPEGEKWSFDKENRLPFSFDLNIDSKLIYQNNNYIDEARKYVNKYFKNNPGETNLYLPIDHAGAKKYLKEFMGKRLNNFGPYEDAVDSSTIYGYHSMLSALINIGLLNPSYIINEVLKYYRKNDVELRSVEGYIRQLFWREYVMYVYLFYDKKFNSNFFGNKNELSNGWFNASTHIQPIDDLINKSLKYGYLHHIERLMYIGNFMLLSKIHPNEVYRWFMSMFIDAIAPWVMKPNVYGMSQFSTGPFMMNRPYFSSSNYIHKMSSYKKRNNICEKIVLGDSQYEWFDVWNALYYNFINDNQGFLKKNYSTSNMVNLWNKKTGNEKKMLLSVAKKYLENY